MWHLNHSKYGNKPWPVQVEAGRRSAGHNKYGYWLEMGMGKTALAMNDFIGNNDADICLIVSPQSFKLDWALAPAEWGLGFLRTGMSPRDLLPFDWDQGLYVVNYEAVSRSTLTKPLIQLMDRRRVMLVIDESKALGNPNSGFTRSVIELAKRAVMVRELNGTPVTQSPVDYYGQLRALGELDGMTATQFRNRYAVLGGYMGKQILPDFKNGEELARLLDRCSFRALKKDWRKDLPPKIYQTVHLDMTDNQRRHYQTMMNEFYALVEDGEITAELVLTQMGKLRQISSGFLLDKGAVHWIEKLEVIPKFKALLEIVGGTYGKTIVVHHHKESGAALVDALTKAKLRPAWIKGGMRPEEVVEQKRRFNDDPECRVIVGQERATALGHTLIGQEGANRCNKMYFYENSFSYYYRAQIEDRNNRGAQDQDCLVIDPVSSPIEQATVDILLAKKEMGQSLDIIVAAVQGIKRG